MIAPAAIQSSSAGRSVPSSHFSPAGISAMRLPTLLAALATACAFRKHPAKVGTSLVARLKVDPLGEGKTRRVPAGIFKSDVGDSEYSVSLFLSKLARIACSD